MLLPVVCAIIYKEPEHWSLISASFLTLAAGGLMYVLTMSDLKKELNLRDSYFTVTFVWVILSLFGTLPYLLTETITDFADALFETVSGFTSTGSSVISDVESLPHSILFWRSLSQWLGGMGIIVLFLALIAGMGARGTQLFKAEAPGGPIINKISPRIRETAQKLWLTYIIISIACCLMLLIFGMNLFDALCHTFTTMATGGFSTKNASIGFYSNPYIQWTIIIFMFIGGTNFSLHYLAYKGRNPAVYIKSPEFRLYAGIALSASFLVALGLYWGGDIGKWGEQIRLASFQVVSIMTGTGYATADYNLWPSTATGVLFLMMFVGGCIGSTTGNIKVGRYLILIRRVLMELKKMIHPKAVLTMRSGDRVINEDLVSNVAQFFFLYFMFLALGVVGLTLLGLDVTSSLTASAACLGNIGPGFAAVGPTQNYAFIPDAGKYLLSALMLIGRLEIFPMLVLLVPAYWKQ